ncbi:MAG: hypothetical protein LC664_12840 [Flavobacteriales bacterium]|nr:hypothetical protein [Flavobacteriales bacterium]
MRAEYLIDAYFANRLTPDEERELEGLLEKDDTLRLEFGIQIEIREAIRNRERNELKEKLRRLDEQSGDKRNLSWLLAAASIVVILGAVWFFAVYSNQPDYNELYAERFDAYPNVVAPLERSQSSESPELVVRAFSEYDNEAYGEAHLSFRELYKEDGSEFAIFYSGVSLMAMGEYDKAIGEFKRQSEWENTEFDAASKWYLALAHLKKGEREMALGYLEELKNSDHRLSREAVELIRVLR